MFFYKHSKFQKHLKNFLDKQSIPYLWDKEFRKNIFLNHKKINSHQKRQAWQKENLLILKQIADSINIPFFISFGTLLGAVREKNFILKDIDVDLIFYINIQYKEKYTLFLQKTFQNGFSLLRNLNPKSPTFISIGKKNQFLSYFDIIFCTKIKLLANSYYEISDYWIPTKWIQNTQSIPFLGQKFISFSKKNNHQLLSALYGKNYLIPSNKKSKLYFSPDNTSKIYCNIRKLYQKIIPVK